MGFFFGEDRAVCDELNFYAKFFDAPNPFDCFFVKKGFANPAKVDAGNWIHLLEPVEDAFKSFLGHVSDTLFPRVAEAGNAFEVAVNRWFDIDFREVCHGAVHADKIGAFVQTDFCARIQPVLAGNFGRKNEASVFSTSAQAVVGFWDKTFMATPYQLNTKNYT